MRRRSVFFFFCIISLLFVSCDPCSNLDCVTSQYGVQLRVVDQRTNKDLIFGSDAVYDNTKIRVYSLPGGDTLFFPQEKIPVPGITNDTILEVLFSPEVRSSVYLELNGADTDTLDITYNTYGTKCCGTITQIKTLSYNGSASLPTNQGVIRLEK